MSNFKAMLRSAAPFLLASFVLFSASAQAATATRTTTFEYDTNTGLLLRQTVEPDTAALKLETTYTYDAFGNVLTTTQAGLSNGVSVTRGTTYVYSADGRFQQGAQNALGHQEDRTFDPRFGAPATVDDPNDLRSTIVYDVFGRKVDEIAPDGTHVKTEYLFCSGVSGGTAVCPLRAKYLVSSAQYAKNSQTNQIGARTKVYFDGLNRQVRTETEGFDGRITTVDVEYDGLGRAIKEYKPYFQASGGTPSDPLLWTESQYDTLDRPVLVKAPDESLTTTIYNGLQTTVSHSAVGFTTRGQTLLSDPYGQVTSVTDALNNVMTYGYDPFGNLVQTKDPAGNIITAKFDPRGRRIELNDPDLGLRTYEYDAFDQVVAEQTANDKAVGATQKTRYTYDLLGRTLTREERSLVSIWTYDTATMGIGKPATACSRAPAATICSFSQSFTYDELGRPYDTIETIDGHTGTTRTTYDSNGRLKITVLPSSQRYYYYYTSRGYLSEVQDNAGLPLWTVVAMDAAGQIVQERFGNQVTTTRTIDRRRGVPTTIRSQNPAGDNVQWLDYEYDPFLNMTMRDDRKDKVSEVFEFDLLNRLKRSQATRYSVGTVWPEVRVTYDALGNIVTKGDVGRYTYGDGTGKRPHAVATIRPTSTGTLNTDYTYDLNGNTLSGYDRTITWTSFDMPALITRGGATVAFLYGTDHQRVKQTKPGEEIRYFSSGIVEKVLNTTTNVTTWTNYIRVGNRLIGTLSRASTVTVAESTVSYFLLDHLGSVDRVADATGAASEHFDFDAWGKRRFTTGEATGPSDVIASSTRRGFTGHEQLDTIGLVHMNARLYDPAIARFISADPVVQATYNLQTFNRYSYGLNNPLSYTDPSGFSAVSMSFTNPSWGYYSAGYTFGGYETWSDWNFSYSSNYGYTFSSSQYDGSVSLDYSPIWMISDGHGIAQSWDFLLDPWERGAGWKADSYGLPYYDSSFEAKLLPWTQSYDNAVTNWERGNYFSSAAYGATGLIDEFMTIASFGEWQGVKTASTAVVQTGRALFSSARGDLAGVERASRPLLDAVGSKRFVTWATPGSEAELYLDMRGAEAVSFGLEDIVLRPNPSKAAVLEEFLHGTQQRLGIVDRLGTRGLGSAETHVKDFMIRHQNMLGLSAEDVARLQTLRDMGL